MLTYIDNRKTPNGQEVLKKPICLKSGVFWLLMTKSKCQANRQ